MNPIYEKLSDVHRNLPEGFHEVCIEISGLCNAKCKYCPSGDVERRLNRGMMNPSLYKDVLEKLISYKIIGKESQIDLFWWGEPTLNPDINDIIEITKDYGIPYVISTNASHYHHFSPGELSGIKRFIISLPGFSQYSYNKIHEFDFELIKENIRRYVRDFEDAGKKDKIWVAYHIYQFNITEIFECYEFCLNQGISFNPGFAFPLLVEERMAYANGTLSQSRMNRMTREIVTDQLDRMISLSDRRSCVYQYRNFIVDELGDVYGCLNLPHDLHNRCGNLFNDDIDDILGNISKLDVCESCKKAGVAPTDFSFKFYYNDFYDFMRIREYYMDKSTDEDNALCVVMVALRRIENSSSDSDWEKILDLVDHLGIDDSTIIRLANKYCMRPNSLIDRYLKFRQTKQRA